jgi:uncharacterized protein involved in outer membrane biogenesis
VTRRRKQLRIVALVAAGILTAVVGARIWLHGAVERAVTKALGRKCTIAGGFDLSLGRTATVVAEDVRIANAPWGSEPYMARAGRVTLSVDLASLVSRPVRVSDVELDDIRILLETDAGGQWNWMPETKPAPPAARTPARPAPRPASPANAPVAPAPKSGPPVVLERFALGRLELVWRARPGVPERTFAVTRLDARVDRATDLIRIDADGRLDAEQWAVAGHAGPFAAMLGGSEVRHDVAGRLGSTQFSSRGSVRNLASLSGPNIDFELHGSDIRQLLAAAGIRSPLAGTFHFRGRLTPATGAVGFDVDAGLASATAAARGRFGSLLRPGTIDASVEASGPDASLVGTWVRVDGLPGKSFDLAGRVLLEGRRLTLDDVRVRAGGTSIAVRGAVGLTRGAVGTDLAVDGSGSDLAELRALTRVLLPAGAFTVRGRFLRRADALAIEDVEVGVHGSIVRGGGTIGEPPRLPNLDLSVDASGTDLSTFSGIARVTLPRSPFSLRGRVARRGRAFALDAVEAQVADDFITVDASLSTAPRMVGSEIQVLVSGPDLRAASVRAGLGATLPVAPYEISGRIHVVDGGYDLSAVEARAGRIIAIVEGHVGLHPVSDGTRLDCSVSGPVLSDLSGWGVAGALPTVPFASSAQIVLAPGRLEVRGGEASLGNAGVHVDGTIGLAARLRGTDVSVTLGAPDTSIASALAGVTLPAGALDARGRIVRDDAGLRFHEVAASIGEIRAKLSGTLGESPGFAMTSLDASASGPDLSLALGPPTGGLPLPAEAFEVSSRVEGGGSHFATNGFRARLGDSDLEGTLTVRRDARVFLDADLRSSRLDILNLSGTAPAAGGVATTPVVSGEESMPAARSAAGRGKAGPPPAPPKAESRPGPRRMFSDTPIPVATLRAIDASVRIPVGELIFPGYRIHDVTIAGTLTDGVVRFERLEAVGPDGGRLTANLVLEPYAGGYRLRSEGALAGARLSVAGSEISRPEMPPLDIEYEVRGEGRSPHAIAASADGRLLLTLGSGRLPNNLGDFLTSGVGRALLEALNPFRKSSPYTTCECGVLAMTLADGKADVDPIVARSDKLTILGHGSVDLHNEAIALEWTLKPREGVGISAGSIANPYVGLGGTLSQPALELKTGQAFASAGAAIATAGGTILLRGIYDRLTAEQQVCVEALERARLAETAPAKR